MLTSEIRIDFHVGKVLEECKPLPVLDLDYKPICWISDLELAVARVKRHFKRNKNFDMEIVTSLEGCPIRRKGSYLTWEGKEWRSWYHPSSIESGLRTVIIENTSAVKEYFALCTTLTTSERQIFLPFAFLKDGLEPHQKFSYNIDDIHLRAYWLENERVKAGQILKHDRCYPKPILLEDTGEPWSWRLPPNDLESSWIIERSFNGGLVISRHPEDAMATKAEIVALREENVALRAEVVAIRAEVSALRAVMEAKIGLEEVSSKTSKRKNPHTSPQSPRKKRKHLKEKPVKVNLNK